MNNVIVRETSPNLFEELPWGQTIVHDDVLHPWQITELWADEELASLNLYRVARVAVTADKVLKGYSFARDGDKVQMVLDLEDAVLKASARQLRLAMNATGLRDDIEQYVASQSRDVQDSWQWTTEFENTHPFVIGAAEQLNKSEADLKSLFLLAQSF
ncbi:hypothetical protein [Bradyrhizobium sp. HKCCYLS20291]|uniref:hypothetical protein n=1 Tax=Bradyrhizobium sp. HKCCYLS20291 TaxID=3420766 RepID=UPI003EBE9BB3